MKSSWTQEKNQKNIVNTNKAEKCMNWTPQNKRQKTNCETKAWEKKNTAKKATTNREATPEAQIQLEDAHKMTPFQAETDRVWKWPTKENRKNKRKTSNQINQ